METKEYKIDNYDKNTIYVLINNYRSFGNLSQFEEKALERLWKKLNIKEIKKAV